MSATGIGGITPNTTPYTGSGFSSLTSEQFSKIIFTELSKQDPLNPSDTNALLQQLSSIRSIQSDMDLTSKLGLLVNENEFASASTLIGKTVSGIDDHNQRVTGKVKSLSRTNDGTVLTLTTGERLFIYNIDSITDSANPANPPPPPPPPPPNLTPQ